MSVTSSNQVAAISRPANTYNTSAWVYFAITLGWSGAFWGIAGLTALPVDTLSTSLLLVLGGIGPSLAAILINLREREKYRHRDFWLRIIDLRRIRPAWYLVIFLTVPLTSLVAVWMRTILTGEPYHFDQAITLLTRPVGLLPLVLSLFFFGPLPEELGWRGFALDRLQSRWNAVTSSIILAAVWAIWHIPLFFIQGTYQQALGFGTAGFWLFLAGIFPETILMTWIFNNTHRSTLAAILYHFMINFTGQFIDPAAQGLALYRLACAAMLALLVIWIFGKNLAKDKQNHS